MLAVCCRKRVGWTHLHGPSLSRLVLARLGKQAKSLEDVEGDINLGRQVVGKVVARCERSPPAALGERRRVPPHQREDRLVAWCQLLADLIAHF